MEVSAHSSHTKEVVDVNMTTGLSDSEPLLGKEMGHMRKGM